MIDRDAGAAAIEQFGGSAQSAAAGRQQPDEGEGSVMCDQATGRGKKARASASSRVRFIGGRLRQMRLP
jgi:hypothetical protein